MKNILLCVVGTEPQVVTLAYHHLAFGRKSAFQADQVFVITTGEGAANLEPMLFEENHGQGQFIKLLKEYGIPKGSIDFDRSNVVVIRNKDGSPLEDIRTDQDNQLAADQISDKIRRLTQDPRTKLHVCLADGRKPMAFYAGYALSLYGREQDELSQVLVNDELSGHPQFFYPPATPGTVLLREGIFSTAKAQIEMANVPYVRLRAHLAEEVLDTLEEGFALADVVSRTQLSLEPIKVQLDCRAETVSVNGRVLHLQPKATAFLWFLALRRATLGEGACLVRAGDNKDEFDRIYSEVDGSVQRIKPTSGLGKCETHKPNEFERDEISALISKIRKEIVLQCGQRVAEQFGEFKTGNYANSSYGLIGIKTEQIEIINDETGSKLPCHGHRNPRI